MLRHGLLAGVCLFSLASVADAQISLGVDFNPADSSRTHMDVGGAWDGASDVSVSGDRFSVTITNTSDTDLAYDLLFSAAVPSGFLERTSNLNVAISGTGVCGAAPVISVSRIVDDLIFDTSGYDLPVDCALTLDFGLVAPSGTASGTYSVDVTAQSSSIEGDPADTTRNAAESFLVRNGAIIFEKTPAVTTAQFGDTVSWTLSARNSGLGGLFDVQLDESGIGAGLSLDSLTPLSPAAPATTVLGSSASLPYLAPGETFSVTVDATVDQCVGLTNLATLSERTGLLSDDADASVQLDLQTPQINYTISSTPVPFGGTGTYSVEITNGGAGDARAFRLDTNLNGQPLNVVTVSPGWSYNAGTGEISLDAGIFPSGTTDTVVITVEDDSNKCSVAQSVTATFLSTFEDDCGTEFTTPADLATVSFAQVPEIDIADGFDPRLETAQSGSYLVTVSATNPLSLDDDPVLVTYTLPGAIADGAFLTPSVGTYTCSGLCGAGDTVEWSIPRAALSNSQTLQVGITTSADPCDAGQSYTGPATVSTSFAANACPIGDTEQRGFLLSNNTYFQATQRFNQTGAPFQTGAPDNGDGIQQEGEGEQAFFEAEYEFDPSDPGVWAGSTYSDDFGGLSAVVLNASTLEYSLNNGAWFSVPSTSVSGGTGTFSIDLAFLAGVDTDTSVAGDSLRIRYQLTAPDSVLNGVEARRVDQFSRLEVQTGLQNNTSCAAGANAVYAQGDRVTWQRAVGEIGITLNDNIVDVCEVLNADVRINNRNNEFPIRNVLTALNLGSDYELVTPSTPSYSGGLGGGASVTYDAAGPDFTLNDEFLTSQGTARIQVRRRANASNQGGALGATLNYDDMQTAPAGSRVFSSTASDAPALVNTAELDIFVAPSTLPVTTDTVGWAITVRNVDAGTAFNAVVSDTIPAGLIFDAADISAMDAANPVTASVSVSTVTWAIGDLAPGASITLNVVASVAGTTCSIPNGQNNVTAEWGCGGFVAQTAVNTRPDLTFPSGKMEVIHDTTGAFASLCGTGEIVLIARNTGVAEIIDVTVSEVLNTASTGISLVPNSVEYQVSGSNVWLPAGSVSGGSTLTFDSTNIPPLALLSANGENGDEVRIRFDINTSALTNGNSGISASGTGSLHCGGAVTSPGSAFTVPVDKPRMRVTKVGRNATRGTADGEDVYAAPGDTIVWTVTVRNQGEIATNELRIRDILAGSNGTATIVGPGISQSVTSDYVAITEIAAGASATYTITEVLGSTCVTAPNTADVTWGCVATATGTASELSSPIDNQDDAELIMVPVSADIDIQQTITNALGTGAPTTNGRVRLEITNNSAPVTAAQLTNTLPTGFRYDASIAPTVSNTDTGVDAYDAVSINASNPAVPVLTLNRGGAAGYLRHGETITIEFAIYQDGSLDTTSDPSIREEDVGSADPAVPVNSSNQVTLNYESGCGIAGSKSDARAVSPLTPDLDVDISDPISRIVSGIGSSETYSIVVTNNGETAAENGVLEVTLGTGWSGSAPTGCGGSIPGTLTCSLSGGAALGTGASRTFNVALSVANETGDLGVAASVTGEILDAASASTGGNYSFDEIEAQTLGFRQTLTLEATSETDFDADTDLQIGEEARLRIESVWFGGGASTISDTQIELDFERLTGFAPISETVPTGQTIATRTEFGTGAPSAVVYDFADFTGGDTITIDVTVRVLNNSANTAGSDFEFVSSASSSFSGMTYDDTASGFPLVTGRTVALEFERPALMVTKEVRNVTLSGTFAATAEGDASDEFEYRITLENTGTAPAFDLSIIDTVPSEFTILDFAADTIDNDGDGASNDADEGAVAGQIITFDRTTANEGKLAELAAGDTLTLLYRTTANATVSPSSDAVNTADYVFDTLDGASGGQTAPTGANNDANGAFEDGDTVTATITIVAVDLTKTLTLTSVGADTSADLVVGEQAAFELAIVLPAGTVNDFIVEDFLPEGLALVARDGVVFGSGVSCATSTTLPATLPASGAPLTASWDFGTCTINPVPEADRTVTVGYTAQVENIAAVDDGDTLTNAAQYNHDGLSDPVIAVPVDLNIVEPNLTLSLVASPATNIDAGQLVTVTYTLGNSGNAPAFNVDLATLLNDNGVDDGADGDVNTSVAYGDNLRDVEVFSCDVGDVNDTTSALGDFLFSHDDGDGDGDTTDEDSDCRSLYQNISTDGFGSGASLTFSTTYRAGANIVLETDYILATLAEATSLPSSVSGFGDDDYERTAANDPTSNDYYSQAATDNLASRNVPNPQKVFTATSDVNTSPDSGNAINVAVGETYTAELTYRFDEGLTRRVTTRERVRLEGPNVPADVEFISARVRRTNESLTAEDNPGGINTTAVGVYVDVTPLIVEGTSGSWTSLTLELGDVTHAGTSGSFNNGRDIESFVVEYTLRVRDVTATREALRLRDQAQMRPYDGDDVSIGFQTGGNLFATIVEPELTVTKTSNDADGILSGGEAVTYTLTATNAGTGPAHNAVLEDTLPASLRANGLSGVTISVDGSPPASAPVFSYNAATGLARWSFSNSDPLSSGDEIEITYTATADAIVAPGSVHTNAFEVAAYYSQADSQPIERRQYDRSNTASVTLGAPEIAFIPDQVSSTQPGSTVIYPHILQVPTSLASGTLDFASSSSRGLGWQVWYDADGNGVLSGGDTRWTNGAVLPGAGDLQFFVQAQVPNTAHDGWRDITTTTASVSFGGTTLSGQVTDITNVSSLQAGELAAGKFMAIDRDCDGSLADESAADAVFEVTKGAAPGECVVYRITFRNEGTGAVTNVDVRDMTPAFTVYVGGSASYETVPVGLTPGTATTPPANDNGALSFPYTGSLPAGEEGAVTYGVRVGE
ncbi:MAG: hypothetical protein AAGH90_02320 [Pseudomonadota bacterium]